MSLFAHAEGSTPLSPEEQDDLIPALATREELNEWERQNILEAHGWALNARQVQRRDSLAESYVRELHRRMFDQTWRWAGAYRGTEKNIGIASYRIREELAVLLGDVRYWMEHQTFAADELAVRLHHRLVWIHPFANGNGRHARLMADVCVRRLGRPEFSWGSAVLVPAGTLRCSYIEALRAADAHDIGPLLAFARS